MGLLSRRDEDFTAFVEQHGDTLLRAAHFLTGDRWAAEDLVQLALTKTYLAWPATRGAVSYAYARQTLLSCHTDTWRRRRWREDTTAPEDLPGCASSPSVGRADTMQAHSDPAHTVAERDGVEQALARLTPRERGVIVLRYLEDLTEKDTARLLNVSVGTVKTLHSRAMARLRADPGGAPPSSALPGAGFSGGLHPGRSTVESPPGARPPVVPVASRPSPAGRAHPLPSAALRERAPPMPISEQQIRLHLRTAPVPGVVDTAAIIATGRRQLRTRRRRRALGAIAPAVLLGAVAGWATTSAGGSDYELAGAGLTLAAGSQGPVQVGDDRVDMGDGLQAWRQGSVLSVGYPVGSGDGEGSHAWLDTRDWGSHWDENSYDIAVLDDDGAVATGTAVVGAVRGTPSRVDVSIEGVTASASIACFVQARGWCSYAVVVPVVVEDHGTMDMPTVKATF